jgi:hypothetical protein
MLSRGASACAARVLFFPISIFQFQVSSRKRLHKIFVFFRVLRGKKNKKPRLRASGNGVLV